MTRRWNLDDMPAQTGRIALITGANRGLGFEIAQALHASSATVILACRDAAKAQHAVTQLRAKHAGGEVIAMSVDLADLTSIRSFAAAVRAKHARLDLLVHNAAAILAPQGRTQDGFEQHFGTNHLGSFALTGLLLDLLRASPDARVIHSGSLAHRLTPGLNLDDPQGEHRTYDPMDAYAKSKLATLSFAFELDRRLRGAGLSLRSVAAHPGYTATNTDLGGFWMRMATRLFAQKPAMGALPALYAATAEDVRGGDYYGPGGLKELGGHPRKVEARPEAHDPVLAAKLWALSEQLTGIRYLAP